MQSRTMEELQVGQFAESSKTVTETDITLFAAISGDFNPVHMDAEFAKSTIFGARVAHGPLTFGLCAGLLGMELPGVGSIAISNYVEYKAPVYIGDTIRTRVEVAALDHERRRATMAVTWTNQGGTVVAQGEMVIRPPKEKAI